MLGRWQGEPASACSVHGCVISYHYLKKHGKAGQVRLYNFPRLDWLRERRDVWTEFVRKTKPKDKEPWEPNADSKICALHFIGGKKSEDPRKRNYNPSIYETSEIVKDIPTRQRSVTCVICSKEAETYSGTYLKHTGVMNFIRLIVGSKQMEELLTTLGSFRDLSLCRSCLSTLDNASNYADNVKVVESRVRNLQNKLLQELKELQAVLRCFHGNMMDLKKRVVEGDAQKLLSATISNGGEKPRAKVFKFRDKIVNTAKELNRFGEKMDEKVNIQEFKVEEEDEVMLDLDETEMTDSELEVDANISDHLEEELIVADQVATAVSPEVEYTHRNFEADSSTVNSSTESSTMSSFRKKVINNIHRILADHLQAKEPDSDHCQSHDWLEVDPYLEYPLVYNKERDSVFLSSIEVEIHDDNKSLVCSFCGFKAVDQGSSNSREENIWNHIAAQHFRVFLCPQCGFVSSSLQQYRDHLSAHPIKFPCEVCKRPCFSSLSLKCHKSRNHYQKPRILPPCPRNLREPVLGNLKVSDVQESQIAKSTKQLPLGRDLVSISAEKTSKSVLINSTALEQRPPLAMEMTNPSPPPPLSEFRQEIVKNIRKKLASLEQANDSDPGHCQSHDWLDLDPYLVYPLVYNKSTGTLSVFNVEIEINDTLRNLECSICRLVITCPGKHNSREEFMWAHIVAHHLLVYQCPQCIQRLGSLEKYREHVRSHKDKFVCQTCGRPCYSEDSLVCHEETHIPVQNSTMKRVPCSRAVNLTHKKRFTKRNPAPKLPLYKPKGVAKACQFCKVPKLIETLQEHELFCVKGPKVPVICDVCGKSFTKKYLFNSHRKVHTTERPFLCAMCPATFKGYQGLHHHMSSHSDERSFICGKGCGAGFKNATTCNKHMRICNGKGTPFRKKAKIVAKPTTQSNV